MNYVNLYTYVECSRKEAQGIIFSYCPRLKNCSSVSGVGKIYFNLSLCVLIKCFINVFITYSEKVYVQVFIVFEENNLQTEFSKINYYGIIIHIYS